MRKYFLLLIPALAISTGLALGIMTRCGWFNSLPRSFVNGAINNERAYGIWSDGDYLYTCGSLLNDDFSNMEIAVTKLNFDETVVWDKTWGGMDHDGGNAICENGTQLFVVGWTESYGAGLRDAVLTQWDLLGNFLQFATWGGLFYDEASSIWLNSSTVYICGTTWSYGSGGSDLFLIKIMPGVTLFWNKTWGGPAIEYGFSVWGSETAVYTAGYTNSCGAGKMDFALVKWDADGEVVWNRTWGGPGDDICKSVWGDGNYIYTCGTSGSYSSANKSILVKWDGDGNIIWNSTRGGSDMSGSVGLWGDTNKIFTCGWTGISPTANTRIMLEEWDPDGNVVNMWLWGDGSSSSYGSSVWGHDDHIYVTGYTFGEDSEYDFVLLKWSIKAFLPGFPFLPVLPVLIIFWTRIIRARVRRVPILEKQEA